MADARLQYPGVYTLQWLQQAQPNNVEVYLTTLLQQLGLTVEEWLQKIDQANQQLP